MKKIPLQLLTILILSTVFTNVFTANTHALYIDEDGTTWYTVPEMLEYKEIVDKEEQELCGDDMDCKQDFFFSKIETDDKFRALEQLTQQQIVVTSVNPAEETLKVLFFDEEMMLKHMGISEKLELGEFYMGWFESDVERIYNYGSYADQLFADTMPGVHLIYAQRDNYGDKIPANQEVDIFAPGSDLNLNTSGEIAYGVYADQFNAAGRFIYTSCLSEPDYEEGTECRLMLSGDKGFNYFPPRETLISSEPTNNNDIEDDITIQDDTTSAPVDDDIEAGFGSMSDESNQDNNGLAESLSEATSNPDITNADQTGNETTEEENPDEPSDSSTLKKTSPAGSATTTSESSNSIKTPETGISTVSEDDTIEFPWWLKVLIGLNTAILLWLFWPSRKKSPKTTKK